MHPRMVAQVKQAGSLPDRFVLPKGYLIVRSMSRWKMKKNSAVDGGAEVCLVKPVCNMEMGAGAYPMEEEVGSAGGRGVSR